MKIKIIAVNNETGILKIITDIFIEHDQYYYYIQKLLKKQKKFVGFSFPM